MSFNSLLFAEAEQALRYYDPARRTALISGLAPLVEYGFPLEKWPMILTPTSVGERAAARAQAGFEAIGTVARSVVDDYYGRDWSELAPVIGMPAHQVRLLDSLEFPEHWWRIARPDTVFVADQPKFLELNLISSIGGLAISDLLVRSLRAWPAGQDWLAEHPMQLPDTMAAVAADVATASVSPGELTVVTRWGPYEPENMPPHFYRALTGELTRCGVPTVDASIVQIDWDGRFPRLAGRRIGCLYRFFDQSDGSLPAKQRLFEQLLGHLRRGTVGMYGDFVGESVLTKAFQARLSQWLAEGAEQLAGLAEPTREALAAVLPWSRVVEAGSGIDRDGQQIDLLEYLRSHRSELVLKPADSYSGDGVLVGRTAGEQQWQAAVERAAAADTPWVVQELLAAPALQAVRVWRGRLVSGPYRAVTGLFFVAGRLTGGICRAAPSRRYVVNPSRGAAQGVFGVRTG
ncbi:MAG TPA: hypothetical protein VFD94_01200 [Jatrophihabitans sp.]|jgi:hypothetical protein|nr:hypothetical protein [Jatrophihabitans sp.]